ncbi:hypothetical protein EOD39_18713 [Acipenser ruthenus]|uniref:Uncharacterized protein n=1 Tax=Acipenser ruthenus TaxID=7906 RepID=A0A444V013_ACIRT|nr:hypothetical protein EOD39_18713 [Acipenser ruthenus]
MEKAANLMVILEGPTKQALRNQLYTRMRETCKKLGIHLQPISEQTALPYLVGQSQIHNPSPGEGRGDGARLDGGGQGPSPQRNQGSQGRSLCQIRRELPLSSSDTSVRGGACIPCANSTGSRSQGSSTQVHHHPPWHTPQ